MKRLVWFLFLALPSYGAETDGGRAGESQRVQQAALTMMADIVPHPPASGELSKMIAAERGSALWGALFGDAQIGALVAVPSAADPESADATLCLLLWQDGGWRFAQRAGRVPAELDSDNRPEWGARRRAPDSPYYILDRFDLYDRREHLSWFCDPQTHTLLPTGWPKDALPSISGRTITFERSVDPGNASSSFEVDEFDGQPGRRIASILATRLEGNRSLLQISLPDPDTKKTVTWRVKETLWNQRYSVSYSAGDGELEPFHEDATMEVQWDKNDYPTNAIDFFIWRLTGLQAPVGGWDEDRLRENRIHEIEMRSPPASLAKPVKAVVVGLPQAVKALSWPVPPDAQ